MFEKLILAVSVTFSLYLYLLVELGGVNKAPLSVEYLEIPTQTIGQLPNHHDVQ